MKAAALAFALAPMILFAADPRKEAIERISDSTTVMQEIMGAPDKGIPEEILGKAQCVGIIPGVKKAGFIVGAKYGKGILVCRTGEGWSGPSTVIVEGGSIGFQIGASETDVVLVVQNKRGQQKLAQDKFTIDASAGATAGPVGRTAQAATDAQLHPEILSYSRSRGLFAGVDLGGASMRPDSAANKAVYGRTIQHQEILDGKASAPTEAKNLYEELNRYAKH
jgi:SH3 domain-containing YSC84-like protein 1